MTRLIALRRPRALSPLVLWPRSASAATTSPVRWPRSASAATTRLTRRAALLGAAALALTTGASFAEDDPLRSGAFRDEVVAILRRERPKMTIETSPDPTILRLGDAGVSLGNLYNRCRGAPQERREACIVAFFDAMAEGFSEPPAETFAAVRARVRPRLVSAAQAASPDSVKMGLLTRPFSPGARIAYVIDNPNSMAFVTETQVKQWAATVEALQAAALDNLDAASVGVAVTPKPPPAPSMGLYAFMTSPDGYAAARLLTRRFMARVADALGPEHFVAAPARDLLLAWSVDCSGKPALAAAAVKYASEGPYPLTDEIFVRMEDGKIRLATAQELKEHGRG